MVTHVPSTSYRVLVIVVSNSLSHLLCAVDSDDGTLRASGAAFPWWAVLLIVLTVLCCAGGALFVLCCRRSRRDRWKHSKFHVGALARGDCDLSRSSVAWRSFQ